MNQKTKLYKKEKAHYSNKNEIYSKKSTGSFISPFSFTIDPMEKLILINFEKDPDTFYNVFELQQAIHKEGNNKFLVVAYRKDGATDVYHQRNFPFASQSTILNDVEFIEQDMATTKFDLFSDHLDLYFDFIDKYGREISVSLFENKLDKKSPFFLLAPIGVVSKHPVSFPIYSLYEMAFVKQKNAELKIEIDKKQHKPDTFPIPIECGKNFLTRYSADAFNIDWNKKFEGELSHLIPTNNVIEEKGITYQLINNEGHYEIKRMSATHRRHQINIDFEPPIPDIISIKEKIENIGSFTISTDKNRGIIKGDYSILKQDNDIVMTIRPIDGWQPNEKRWILKFMFLIIKIFKDWPKSYIWKASIKVENPGKVIMKSCWERI